MPSQYFSSKESAVTKVPRDRGSTSSLSKITFTREDKSISGFLEHKPKKHNEKYPSGSYAKGKKLYAEDRMTIIAYVKIFKPCDHENSHESLRTVAEKEAWAAEHLGRTSFWGERKKENDSYALYLVTDFFDGPMLFEYDNFIRSFSMDVILSMLIALADGLKKIPEDIINLDLKNDNVFFNKEGGVHIIDFGGLHQVGVSNPNKVTFNASLIDPFVLKKISKNTENSKTILSITQAAYKAIHEAVDKQAELYSFFIIAAECFLDNLFTHKKAECMIGRDVGVIRLRLPRFSKKNIPVNLSEIYDVKVIKALQTFISNGLKEDRAKRKMLTLQDAIDALQRFRLVFDDASLEEPTSYGAAYVDSLLGGWYAKHQLRFFKLNHQNGQSLGERSRQSNSCR